MDFINQNFTLSISEERAGNDIVYVAQCEEYDICVQGSTLGIIKERFRKSILGHIAICTKLGEIPFACLSK